MLVRAILRNELPIGTLPRYHLHIFSLVMAGCAADTWCHKSYPHLSTEFSAVIKQLNAHPATVTVAVPDTGIYTALLTGDILASAAFMALYSSEANGSVPELIDTASHGARHAPCTEALDQWASLTVS